MLEMVGNVFTAGAPTVTTNVSLTLKVPSLTVMVIVVEPDWPPTGTTATERAAPVPEIKTSSLGTKVVFDDDLVTVRFEAGVSASPIVNPTSAVAVPFGVD